MLADVAPSADTAVCANADGNVDCSDHRVTGAAYHAWYTGEDMLRVPKGERTVTFTVTGPRRDILGPDLGPRAIAAAEWHRLFRGQDVAATAPALD